MRKLRRADELAAAGQIGDQIATELGVSAATLYNWHRQYGGIDTDAAKELKELREQSPRLKRLLTDAELEKDWFWSRTSAPPWSRIPAPLDLVFVNLDSI